jgi:hypothetical protein
MRDKVFERLSHWATQHTWRMLLAILAVTLIALALGSRLRISTRWEDLLPENDPIADEFSEIIKQYDSASSIIVVVQGDEDRIKRFADEVAGPISKVKGVKRVTYKLDVDFIRKHGFMLARRKDLLEFKEMFADLSLELFLTKLNDNFEKTYIYSEDEERLSTKEKTDEAIQALDGIKFWLETMRLYFEGKGDPELAKRAVDRIVVGEPYFLSYNRKLLMMIVQPNFPITAEMGKILGTVNGIRRILDEAKRRYLGVEADLTGSIAMQADEYKAIASGMWWTSIIAFLMIITLFIFAFRMFVAPVLAGIVLIVGVIWTSAFATLATGYLNMMTTMFAAILFGLGVDFAIHIISGFTEHRGRGLSIEESVSSSLRKVGPGVFTGAMTTAMALLTITISRTRGMRQFGLIMGMGVFFCMLATFLLLPPLLVLRERRLERKGRATERRFGYEFTSMGRFAEKYSGTGWVGLVLAVLVTLFFGYQANRLEFNYNMLELEPKGMISVEIHDKLIEEFDISPDYALVRAPDLKTAREIVDRAKRYPNIAMVDSITRYLPDIEEQREKAAIIEEIRENLMRLKAPRPIDRSGFENIISQLDRLWMNITEMSSLAFQAGQDRLERKCYDLVADPEDPESRDYIKELISLFSSDHGRGIEALNGFQKDYFGHFRKRLLEMANPEPITLEKLPREILSRYRSKDGKYFLITITPKKAIWNYENLRTFSRQLREISPRATGMPPMFLSLMGYMAKDGKRALILALAAVVVLLLMDFRSLRFTFLALIPLIAGAAWMGGLMKLFGMKLNFNNVIAFPLIIGIGIDDGVHLIHRYRIEGWRRIGTIFSNTGKAILLTSLTTMIGFGSLIFMTHRGMASMGEILVIGIGSCFITTLLILAPAFRTVKFPGPDR